VDEEVDVAGAEDKAAAELEGVLAQAVLSVAAGRGTFSCPSIIAPEEVEHGCLLEADGMIGLSLFVHQQGKGDAGLLLEGRGIAPAAKADRCQSGASLIDFLLVAAQLRDVLAAEDSAVVAQEDQHCGTLLPQRAEADLLVLGVRQ